MSDPRNPRSHEDTDRGLRGEEWVADEFGLEPCNADDWCDLVNPRTGTKHEVKVAAPGARWRIWRDNHRSLTTSDGQGTAWYDLLVMDGDGRVLEHRRMSPSTMTRIVRERGGWNRSGHVRGDRGGDDGQHKVPVDEVV